MRRIRRTLKSTRATGISAPEAREHISRPSPLPFFQRERGLVTGRGTLFERLDSGNERRQGKQKAGGTVMKLKGSRTEKNILTAFCGESQARNRYTYFGVAGEEGGVHPDRGHLRGDRQPGEGAREAALLQSSKAATSRSRRHSRRASSARRRRTSSTPRQARTTSRRRCTRASPRSRAKRGSSAVAKVFEAIAVAEKQHEKRYLGLLGNVEAGTVFKKDKAVTWRCRNCGYTAHGRGGARRRARRARIRRRTYEVLAENW